MIFKPAAPRHFELQQFVNAGHFVNGGNSEGFLQFFHFVIETQRFRISQNANQFVRSIVQKAFEFRFAFIPLLFPIRKVDPLPLGKLCGRVQCAFAFKQNAAYDPVAAADGDSEFISANTGVAQRLSGHETHKAIAFDNAACYELAPILIPRNGIGIQPDFDFSA